ncbi:MAG: hypothetical protein LBU65_03150 [Planctomycetaceae bacterium]|jgi:hypothetical protein|nr:hypothetical protein [Planctomycetaceae bacterium]
MKKLSIIFVMLFVLTAAVNAQDMAAPKDGEKEEMDASANAASQSPTSYAALKDGEKREMDDEIFYYVSASRDKDIAAFWIMEKAMFPSSYEGSEGKPGWIKEHSKEGTGENLLTISYRIPNAKGREWYLARIEVLMPVILNWDTDIQPKLQNENDKDWKDVRGGLKDILHSFEEKGTAKRYQVARQISGVDNYVEPSYSSASDFVLLTDWAEENKIDIVNVGQGGGQKEVGDALRTVWENIPEEVKKLLYLESGSQHIVNATALRGDWLLTLSDTWKKKTPEEWKLKYEEYEKNIKDYAIDKTVYVEAYKDKTKLTIPDALKKEDDFFRYAAEVK